MSSSEARPWRAHHIPVLDGVRAISILLVVAGHWIPLGPKFLKLNDASCAMGMALFFVLSGFLITKILQDNNNIVEFLIKRLARIVPLAFLFMAAVFMLFNRDLNALARELTFTLNYHDEAINAFNPHLWSLCVEVQFYAVIGLLFWLLRKPAPVVVAGLCVLITVLKIAAHDAYSMQTQLRGDELLAGSLLCLSVSGAFGDHTRFWRWIAPFAPVLLALFFLTCQPSTGLLDDFRAYAAALLVGAVLFTGSARLAGVLSSRPMVYIAKISYAVYIIHVGAAAGVAAVLGSGSKLGLYLIQRPIAFVATWVLAHLSTFYYEKPWNALGQRLVLFLRQGRRGGAIGGPQSKSA